MFSNSESSGGVKFAKASNGTFCINVEQGTPNAVTRINANGKEVHELKFDTVSGKIYSLDLTSNTFQGEEILSLNVGLNNVGDKAKVQMKFPSAYARGFLNRLDNIDFSSEVTLKIGSVHDKDKDKNVPFLIVLQNGKKLDSNHTQDKPNGLPQLVKVKFKGKDTWDDTDQQEFYKAKIEKFKAKVEANQSPVAPKINAEAVASIDSDDLPF